MRCLIFCLMAGFCMVPATAQSQSFRHQGEIVHLGDTKFEVLKNFVQKLLNFI